MTHKKMELTYTEYFELKRLCSTLPDSLRINQKENFFKISISSFFSFLLAYLAALQKAQWIIKDVSYIHLFFLILALIAALFLYLNQRGIKVANKRSKDQLLAFFEHIENNNLGQHPVKVLHAEYGANDDFRDKTQDIRNRVDNNGINFQFTRGLFIDHVPNVHKILSIQYIYEGKIYTKYFKEDEQVIVP